MYLNRIWKFDRNFISGMCACTDWVAWLRLVKRRNVNTCHICLLEEPLSVLSMHRLEKMKTSTSLPRRHNDHDGVSNHQPRGCLLNRLFRRRSKKTSKLRVTGLCEGNSPGPVNSPHKGLVTRKMFPFDDVIMFYKIKLHVTALVYDSLTTCNILGKNTGEWICG